MDERHTEAHVLGGVGVGRGSGASVSLSELLELVVAPSSHHQHLQKPQQIPIVQQLHMDGSMNMNPARRSMGTFLDELIMDNWDDDGDDENSNDSNDDGELFLHGNGDETGFPGMEAFSTTALLGGAAAAPSTQDDAVPTPAFTVPVALNNHSYSLAVTAISGPPSQNKKPRLTIDERKKVAIAAPKRTTTTAFVPGKTRMRRKLEIQLLREESEKLQQKLQNLREYWKLMSVVMEHTSRAKNAADSSMNQPMRATLVRAESMWKPIAVRQREVLSQSERENQDLKTQFLLQRKMLQRTRKLILKRVNTAKKMQSEIQLQLTPNPQFRVTACASTFHKLLADSVSMYMDFGKVQSLFHMRNTKKQVFREWAVKEDAVGSRLEMVDSNVTPFNRTQVGRELLRLYGVCALGKKKHIGEYFDASDDTIVQQYISSFDTQNSATGHGVVRVKQVVRSFSDESQSVFVINTLLERLTENGTALNPIRAKKWVIIRSCGNGLSAGANSGSPASSIQSFYTLKPEVPDGEYSAFWCKPMLEEILVPILDVGTTEGYQELENALIKQGSKVPKRVGISAH